jgi:fatty acid CoA ligase FadD22
LTSYKVPEDVEFIDALPRNSTGKILRRVLRGANRELPDGTA